jgi:hypothetical protein
MDTHGPARSQLAGQSCILRAAVDAVATGGRNAGLLQFGPTFLNPYAGYLCILRDPDGDNVEFSHGQALGKPLDHTDAAKIAR